jgi:hypothetical protein
MDATWSLASTYPGVPYDSFLAAWGFVAFILAPLMIIAVVVGRPRGQRGLLLAVVLPTPLLLGLVIYGLFISCLGGLYGAPHCDAGDITMVGWLAVGAAVAALIGVGIQLRLPYNAPQDPWRFHQLRGVEQLREVELAVLAIAWRNRHVPPAERFDPNDTPQHPAEVYGWEVLKEQFGHVPAPLTWEPNSTPRRATLRAFRELDRRGLLVIHPGSELAADLTAAGVQVCDLRFPLRDAPKRP